MWGWGRVVVMVLEGCEQCSRLGKGQGRKEGSGGKFVPEITSSGWPFVSAVLGQMAHLVASITLDSARSYVMQSAFLTQGTVSSIPIIFSWGGSISPEGFLSSVLLWLVIIVAVVGVGVTVVVVVESSSVIKLSFVIT
ncbi:hypothetical protein Tco_0695315 [Tanacetum coccineum]